MDKDRDISRRITISIPKKVSFVGSAVLAVSLAACGGGSSKPVRTPEGGVAGVAVQPSTGASPIVVETAVMPSATAVIEAPTAIVTAANSEVLTEQQRLQVANEVNGLLDRGFQGVSIPSISDQIPRVDERDPEQIKYSLGVCVGTTPFPYRDAKDKAMAESDVTWKATGFSNFCSVVGEATKLFYDATGKEEFKQANIAMEKIHFSVIKGFQAQDPRIKDAAWKLVKGLYYPFGATGTSNN